MTYSYNASIPAANNDPADDQPLMQTNFSSISSLVAVDHVGFNTANGGYHNQVTVNTNTAPAAPSGNVSIIHSKAGTALSSAPQLFWINSQATFLLSAIRAFGTFTGTTGAIIGSQSLNATVARTGTGHYTVTITNNAVSGTDYFILLSCGRKNSAPTTDIMAVNYTISSATQFNIDAASVNNAADDPTTVTFVVLQI